MDGAPGGLFQACGEFHESRFAATRGAHDGDELALANLQVDVFYSKVVLRQQVFVVGQPDILEIDEIFGLCSHLLLRQDVEFFGGGQERTVPDGIRVDTRFGVERI